MPTIISRGAFSGKAFGLTGQTATPVYVEDVFSTYLFTSTGTTQTITNNIDLSTKGGMVWCKNRSASGDNVVGNTVLGNYSALFTNSTAAASGASYIADYSTTGFTVVNSGGWLVNNNNYVSWTFRKQPKFFDIVTYTGDGTNRTIAHNLGATPGMIIVKRTDTTSNWRVYHNGLTSAANSIQLNLTAAQASATTVWNSTAPTSTVFSVGTDATVNASGGTYVAYLFAASNSGGFGSAGTDSVVACGSFNKTSSTDTITLGWEPQWILVKNASQAGSWRLADTMRGMSVTFAGTAELYPNSSVAETNGVDGAKPTPTGFTYSNGFAGENYIYLAIRRGPMKVPTSGTSVFSPVARAGTGAVATISTSFSPSASPDLCIAALRSTGIGSGQTLPVFTRLIGPAIFLKTPSTAAENSSATDSLTAFNNITVTVGADTSGNMINGSTSNNYINWIFARAPGFMDVVCYTGTGVARTVAHNLGVAPELMIVKSRSRGGEDWPILTGSSYNRFMYLNQNIASALNVDAYNCFGNGSSITPPTSSVFTVGTQTLVNANIDTYVAYLFATCPGVSKVGSYTGTGAAQNINCGFSAGARFVLIKRTDSTGDWYVYDSARGISSGNDPYLLLNSSTLETTGTNYVDTFASGFTLTATAPAALNANGGSYIFLAIA